jgi:hypothetical protein
LFLALVCPRFASLLFAVVVGRWLGWPGRPLCPVAGLLARSPVFVGLGVAGAPVACSLSWGCSCGCFWFGFSFSFASLFRFPCRVPPRVRSVFLGSFPFRLGAPCGLCPSCLGPFLCVPLVRSPVVPRGCSPFCFLGSWWCVGCVRPRVRRLFPCAPFVRFVAWGGRAWPAWLCGARWRVWLCWRRLWFLVGGGVAVVALCGFSGSRLLAPCWSPLVAGVVRGVVGAGLGVAVGCAPGADRAVRSAARSCGASPLVFSVSSGRWGSGRGAFAARSVACVRAVAASGPGARFCAFVSSSCPAGLFPGPSPFVGLGSGSWASCALAAWLGLPLVVFWCGGGPPVLPSSWGVWSPVASGPFAGGFRLSPRVASVALPGLGVGRGA